jgi:hypothetical protein
LAAGNFLISNVDSGFRSAGFMAPGTGPVARRADRPDDEIQRVAVGLHAAATLQNATAHVRNTFVFMARATDAIPKRNCNKGRAPGLI